MVAHLLTRKLRYLLPIVVVLAIVFAPAVRFAGDSIAAGFVSADEGEGDSGQGGDDNSGSGEGDSDNSSATQGDDDGDDHEGPGNQGRGNCDRGNQGEDKGKGEKKGHDKCDDVEVNPVPLAQLYLVAVACQFQSSANVTTCLFVGGTEFGIGDVTRVSIPEEMACTEVTGGTFATLAVDGLGQALTSPDGAQAVTLVFAGRVRTSGEASYRVTTANGLFPATGPGLQCGEATQAAAPAELSSTTGAVRVIANGCPAGIDPETVDWYATCATPSAGVTFRLLQNGVSTDGAQTGTTDENGNLVFPNLAAGTYHLSEDGGNWCHAESDSVDANGDVIVGANERATVWIFHCPAAAS